MSWSFSPSVIIIGSKLWIFFVKCPISGHCFFASVSIVILLTLSFCFELKSVKKDRILRKNRFHIIEYQQQKKDFLSFSFFQISRQPEHQKLSNFKYHVDDRFFICFLLFTYPCHLYSLFRLVSILYKYFKTCFNNMQ